LEDLTLTNGEKLGKNPEDYPNAKSEPQVQVALRMKKRGDPVRVNDVIAYVITGDGQDYTKNVAERAYPPQDVSKVGSELQIGIPPTLYGDVNDRLQLLSCETDFAAD
jgi:DNA polymerase alpha subunit A